MEGMHNIRSDHSRRKSILRDTRSVEKPVVITLPVLCRLIVLHRWTVELDNDNVFHVVVDGRSEIKPPRIIAAAEVRQQFLSLKTLDQAKSFCERYGPLADQGTPSLGGMFSEDLVWEFQERLSKDRELPASEFFNPQGALAWTNFFERQPPEGKVLLARVPYFEVTTHNCHSAMLYANYFDQIAGVRVATCPKCANQFEVPDNKRKVYCSDECQRKAGKARWKLNQPLKGATDG